MPDTLENIDFEFTPETLGVKSEEASSDTEDPLKEGKEVSTFGAEDEKEENQKKEKSKEEESSEEDQEKKEQKKQDDEGVKDDEDTKDKEDKKGKEEEGEKPSTIEIFAETLGAEIDEEDKEKYTDDLDGLKQLVSDTVQQQKRREVSTILEQHPNVKKLLEFEKAGGESDEFIEAFYPSTDYTEIKIDENNTRQHKEIIEKSFKERGFSQNRIDRTIQLLEDNGQLYDESKDALKDLQSIQEERKQKIETKTEKLKQQQQKEVEETRKQVQNIITDNKEIAGLPIPEKDKTEFQNFILGEDKNREKIMEDISVEEQIALEYIVFKGISNFAKSLKNTKNTTNTKQLKDLIEGVDQTNNQGQPGKDNGIDNSISFKNKDF